MKVIEQLERLKYIHKLIENQQTGAPDEFAQKIYIGKRHLFRLLDELRLLGAPIKYNTLLKTYYYSKQFSFDVSIKIECLNEHELERVTGGGCILFHKNYIISLLKSFN